MFWIKTIRRNSKQKSTWVSRTSLYNHIKWEEEDEMDVLNQNNKQKSTWVFRTPLYNHIILLKKEWRRIRLFLLWLRLPAVAQCKFIKAIDFLCLLYCCILFTVNCDTKVLICYCEFLCALFVLDFKKLINFRISLQNIPSYFSLEIPLSIRKQKKPLH